MKMAIKTFSSNISHLAHKQSTQSFKKEIEIRKKKLSFPFLKIKNCRFLKKLQGFEVERRKGIKMHKSQESAAPTF